MNQLYPLKFQPLYKEKIWGGNKINTVLGLDYGSLPNCGEAWMLSGVEGSPSVVKEGFLKGNELNELVEIYMGELVGEKVFEKFGTEFPLLIKFIDANDKLSIQVHPDDILAQERHNSYGKTEMWYVLQADKGAELISGFNKELDRESYLKYLTSGKITEVLNTEKVKKEDAFFMPAGRVHAIGKGILLAEIQQTSDVTYRIYDWDRKDEKGTGRELHTEQAIEAFDFKKYENYKTKYQSSLNSNNNIVKCPYFTTNILWLDKSVEKDYAQCDSFIIYLCLEGNVEIDYEFGKTTLEKGEMLLVPAEMNTLAINPTQETKLLETYIV